MGSTITPTCGFLIAAESPHIAGPASKGFVAPVYNPDSDFFLDNFEPPYILGDTMKTVHPSAILFEVLAGEIIYEKKLEGLFGQTMDINRDHNN